jgi:hypothetical protein
VVVAALGGQAGLDLVAPGGQAGLEALLAPGRGQAAGVQDLLAGPGLLDPGAGQGLADLVVVLDQALDPGVHAVDGRLDAGRLGPETGDLPGRGLVRGGAGEQHEDDEQLPGWAQGEVPFAWRVGGRAGTLSRRHHQSKYQPRIPLRL